MSEKSNKKGSYFDAIVLAGERTKDSPLTRKFQVPAKAFIPVGGTPMVQRVLEALSSSGGIRQIYLCGAERRLFEKKKELTRLINSGRVLWIQNERTPSRSAFKALVRAGGDQPVLLTTADHALLTADMADFFCTRAQRSGRDLVVGLAGLKILKRSYPAARRTSYKFREGSYCTCNLFGFMNKDSFRAARFWQKVEERRKNPLKIIGSFGWYWVLRYITGTLSLSQALNRASRVLGCSAGAAIMPFPEAAIDVDSVSDWELADAIVRGNTADEDRHAVSV